MSNANVPTRSVVVQTTLRVIENSDEGNLVVSDRGCQTAIAAHPSFNEVNLLPLLEFIPYSEIDKGGVRVIQLPRKALLQFNLSGELPTRTFSESAYKSVLKKSLSNSSSSTLHLPHHLSSMPMAKIYEDQLCQTDLSVSPYILEEDSVANVRREIGAQTSVTFEPLATINEIEPGLKGYLSHSHCFVAIYQQGKFTIPENYQTQTDNNEIQEVEVIVEEGEEGEGEGEGEEEKVADDDASRSVPQQTEISVSEPQKTRKHGSLDFRYMTDEEFDENIGEILDKTVENVTVLLKKVVKIYERSRPDLQKTGERREAKKAEPSEDGFYFPVKSIESEVKPDEIEVKSGETDVKSGELQVKSGEPEVKPDETEVKSDETDKVDLEETEKVESVESKEEKEEAELEETEEVKLDEIEEAEPIEIKEIESVETERDEESVAVQLNEPPREEAVTEPRVDFIEVNADNEEVPAPILESEVDVVDVKDQVEGKEMEVASDIRDDVDEEDDNIENDIRGIIERVIEFVVVSQQVASIPVGDTPEIKRKTHIECECEHPREAGAAPPTVPSPALREEPKRETPEKVKDEDRIVVEAVEGKPVTLELVVTKEDGIALRDSVSCPETCSIQVPCSDLKEQIIRLSVVLAQQHVPCKTVDNKLVQATQSDTKIYVSQKPSTLSCGCTLQSIDSQAEGPVIPEVTSVCSETEEMVWGDRILETCGKEVSFREPAEEICNCLSMQSYQCGIISITEETRKSEGKLCECSTSLDASPFLQEMKREDARCICDEPIEIIYPEQSVCSCNFASSTCLCGGKTDLDEIVSGTCVCSEEFSLPEICSYCRNLQETSGVRGDGSDVRTCDSHKEEEKSEICTCVKLSQEIISTTCSCGENRVLRIKHPEGQKLSKSSYEGKEIALQRYCDSVCEKNVAAQTMLITDSVRLIYKQSRNIVEPYMDKLRNYKTEVPQVQESSLLYLRDRRSIEQYMKTLDPEDARDLMKTRIPISKKSSIKKVISKQMTLAAVEMLSTTAISDGVEKNQLVTTNVTVRAASWKVGEEFQTAFDSSFIKDTLTYVTNEEEVKVVERDSKITPIQSACSTAVGPDSGNLVQAASSETKKDEEVAKDRESVRFLFVEEERVTTPTQSQPTIESKRTPDPTQITPPKPEFLSNLDTDKMPCQCQQAARTLAASEPTPNLTCLFEDDSEYHEGYMEEMTDENVSVQTQLNPQDGKVPLVECAASLPDMTIETNRCDSKIEMPWLRISLPPVGYYQIDRMEGRPKKETCDCWKLDTRDSVYLAEPAVQKVICPARTPDEYKALNLEGQDENVTGDSEDAEDDTAGQADAEETLEDQTPVDEEVGEDQPVEEEEGAGENEAEKEESAGEDQPAKLQVDKKVCACLSDFEEDDCAEFKKPMQFVYDNLCYEANEAYMDAIYKSYPDDCDTECGSRTEIPWEDIILPTRVKLRATKKDNKLPPRLEVVPLYENAAVKGVTEKPSRARSDKSAKSDKSIHSQRSKKSAKERKQGASSTFEIELNFAEAVSNLINIDGGAATQATVSQISAISDVRMIPRRCPKDYIITVKTAAGMEQRFGGGMMQTVGSQPFDYKTSQMMASGSKIPEKTKSCEVAEVNESSAAEENNRKAKSMPDVPSKTSNGSAAFAKFLTVKSGDQTSIVAGGFVDVTQKDSRGKGSKDTSGASGSFKPVRVRISKESTGKSGSLKSKDPTLVMVTSEGSRGSQISARAKEMRTKDSACVCRCSKPKEPVFFDVEKPIGSVSSKESRGSSRPLEAKYPGVEMKRPVVTYNTLGSRDPVMEALKTYQEEMKPLRETLDRLKAKIQDLNLPELSSWSCSPEKSGATPSTSMYGRRGVGYQPNMMGAPYGMPPPLPNMFGMGPPLPPSYYLPNQFNFVPPPNLYHPSPLGRIPPQQFQTYPSNRSVVCKGRRSKSRTRRRHRRHVSSRSSSEVSEYSASGDEIKCPFLGTASGVSSASLPKTCTSKVKRSSSKGRVCPCRQKRHAKTETRSQRIAQNTRAEPEVKIHFGPRDDRSGRGRISKAVQHVGNKTPPCVKNNKVRVAVRITPSCGRSSETENPLSEDSCPCKD